MARRVCLYCHRDYGEAQPAAEWAAYPADTVTHGVCDSPFCHAALKLEEAA